MKFIRMKCVVKKRLKKANIENFQRIDNCTIQHTNGRNDTPYLNVYTCRERQTRNRRLQNIERHKTTKRNVSKRKTI